MEYSLEREVIVLAPGERADVLVAPKIEAGSNLTLINVPFDRGYGSVEFRSADDLIALKPVRRCRPFPRRPSPKLLATFRRCQPTGAGRSTSIWSRQKTTACWRSTSKGGHSGGSTSVKAALGETQLWTIKNNAMWAHPIHLHGFFFQEVDDKGNPVSPRAWKDTIHVAAESTKRFLVKLDRPGSWMYHCHILDHAEAGLMSTVDVGGDTSAPHAGEHKH